MDPIKNSLPPKIMIEQVEEDYLKSKECIEQLDCIHIAEFKDFIESPITSEMKINLFLREWKNVKKMEIESFTCKVQLQFDHAQYKGVEYLLDVFTKWQSYLG